MKKWVCLILIILLVSNVSACTSQISSKLPEITLPEKVELGFKSIELTPLREEKANEKWEPVKSLPFGTIDNESVTLNLYKETNNGESLYKAQLVYQGHTYTLQKDVSSSVVEGAANEFKPNLVLQPIYLFQKAYGDKNGQIILQGGIELFANGPGMLGYLVYDKKTKAWLQFEEWGIPYLADLDADKGEELIVQFPGLHMQTPDVRIIRWNGGKLEGSDGFQKALGIEGYQPSPVYMQKDDNIYFSVDVNTQGDSDMVNLAKAFYKYEKGKLVKVQENATYTNNEYAISLDYPSSWKPNDKYAPSRYEGSDGFFLIDAVAGVDSIDEVAGWDAYHKLKPYGSEPTIEKLTIAGQEARLILPASDQPVEMKGQAGLIVRYPNPVTIKNQAYRYFVLWADKEHIRSISETLKFIR